MTSPRAAYAGGMRTEKKFGQESWKLESDKVRAWLRKTGGHVGPVEFLVGGKWVQPFSVAPWYDEKQGDLPDLLHGLRGDFFCLPFGGNETPYQGEKHPAHGETAERAWEWVGQVKEEGGQYATLQMKTKIRPGLVTKRIGFAKGQSAIFCEHVVEKMSGPMDFGHHAMLKFPAREGVGHISFSGYKNGQVFPGQFENPVQGGYTSLKQGAKFQKLSAVPKADGAKADLTKYPAREGFEDLVMVHTKSAKPFAWVAVAIPSEGYVFFALKDPRVLSRTILWHSNGGRHYAPWSGRHRGVLGIEDVTAHFHYGLAESAKKPGAHVKLNPKKPLVVRYIMALAAIPKTFDEVASITPGKGTVTLRSKSGKSVKVPLTHEFLMKPSP